MASSSCSSSSHQSYRYIICHCGEKMYILTSWTSKNPGRRFVRCPKVKSGYCTTFSFIDEELPNQYYKDLLYELRSQTKNVNTKAATGNEEDDSKLQLLKAMEELTFAKSKIKLFDQVFLVLIAVVAMLCVVIGMLVIN